MDTNNTHQPSSPAPELYMEDKHSPALTRMQKRLKPPLSMDDALCRSPPASIPLLTTTPDDTNDCDTGKSAQLKSNSDSCTNNLTADLEPSTLTSEAVAINQTNLLIPRCSIEGGTISLKVPADTPLDCPGDGCKFVFTNPIWSKFKPSVMNHIKATHTKYMSKTIFRFWCCRCSSYVAGPLKNHACFKHDYPDGLINTNKELFPDGIEWVNTITTCPDLHTRSGRFINMVLPTFDTFFCLEPNCNWRRPFQTITEIQEKLSGHYNGQHLITIKGYENWCFSCKKTPRGPLANHRCFPNKMFIVPTPRHVLLNIRALSQPTPLIESSERKAQIPLADIFSANPGMVMRNPSPEEVIHFPALAAGHAVGECSPASSQPAPVCVNGETVMLTTAIPPTKEQSHDPREEENISTNDAVMTAHPTADLEWKEHVNSLKLNTDSSPRQLNTATELSIPLRSEADLSYLPKETSPEKAVPPTTVDDFSLPLFTTYQLQQNLELQTRPLAPELDTGNSSDNEETTIAHSPIACTTAVMDDHPSPTGSTLNSAHSVNRFQFDLNDPKYTVVDEASCTVASHVQASFACSSPETSTNQNIADLMHSSPIQTIHSGDVQQVVTRPPLPLTPIVTVIRATDTPSPPSAARRITQQPAEHINIPFNRDNTHYSQEPGPSTVMMDIVPSRSELTWGMIANTPYVFHPLSFPLLCPIHGCSHRVEEEVFPLHRTAIADHLVKVHNLATKFHEVIRWCKLCNNMIDGNVSTHPCLLTEAQAAQINDWQLVRQKRNYRRTRNAFPHVTSCNGTLLNIVFPMDCWFNCNKSDCTFEVEAKLWTKLKEKIIKHMKTDHNSPVTETVNWCIYCEKIIMGSVPKHSCLLHLESLMNKPPPGFQRTRRANNNHITRPAPTEPNITAAIEDLLRSCKANQQPVAPLALPIEEPISTNSSENHDPTIRMPTQSCRTGTTQNYLFPTSELVSCTEPNCSAQFKSASWYTTKASLKRHYRVDHKKPIHQALNWCRECKLTIPRRVATHQCLKGKQIVIPSTVTLKFQCSDCDYSTDSKRGLRNHIKGHMQRTRKAIPLKRPPPPKLVTSRKRFKARTVVSNNPSNTPSASLEDFQLTRPRGDNRLIGTPLRGAPNVPAFSRKKEKENTDECLIIQCEDDLHQELTEENPINPRTYEIPAPLPDEEEPDSSDSSDNHDDQPAYSQAAEVPVFAMTSTPEPSDSAEQEDPLTGFLPTLSYLLQCEDDNAWELFTETLDEITNATADAVNLPEPSERNRRRLTDPQDAEKIQKLYRRNRRQAVRLITEGKPSFCQIPTERLEEHFSKSLIPTNIDLSIYGNEFDHLPADTPPVCVDPFTVEEVLAKLRACENSAPGNDRITYQHWRSVDPEAKALTAIYNICLKHRRVPKEWKISRTILLHKKGDREDIGNWRPIALGPAIYRLYSGLLAKRATSWAMSHSIFSHCQKGFLPHDGVFEHNFIVQQRIQNARMNGTDVCIGSTDIINAFGSIPHEVAFMAMEAARMGDGYIQIMRDALTDSYTEYVSEEGTTALIRLLLGFRQGCPMSGFMYNITVDRIIRKLQADATTHRVLAFADDAIFIAENPVELQRMLDTFAEEIEKIGLRINVNKSYTLHISGATPCGTRDTKFLIYGRPVPSLRDEDAAPFLGKPIGFRCGTDQDNINEFLHTANKIMTSKLAPWQRIDALKAFFFPSLAFQMRTAQHLKGEWEKIDEFLVPHLRETLSLPIDSTRDYFYGDKDRGMMGIPQAAHDSDIAHIDGAYKLLESSDPIVRDLAWSDLNETVRARTNQPVTTHDIAAYLSGASYLETSNRISSCWTNARKASVRLKVTWNCQDDGALSLSCESLKIKKKNMIFKSLRKWKRNAYADRLCGLKKQGRSFPCIGKAKASCHFFNGGDFMRFADWRFIHRARLRLVPLRAYTPWDKNIDKRCRYCKKQPETLPHVVCHCRKYSSLIQQRHNSIVARVKKAAMGRWKVLKENQRIGPLDQRPDLIIEKADSVIILDVTVTFEEGPDAFQKARNMKIDKYSHLIDQFSHNHTDVKVEAIVVGALGAWDPANDRVLRRLCSRKYITLMRKLIVCDTIRVSRDIYVEHVTGVKQIPWKMRKAQTSDDITTNRQAPSQIRSIVHVPNRPTALPPEPRNTSATEQQSILLSPLSGDEYTEVGRCTNATKTKSIESMVPSSIQLKLLQMAHCTTGSRKNRAIHVNSVHKANVNTVYKKDCHSSPVDPTTATGTSTTVEQTAPGTGLAEIPSDNLINQTSLDISQNASISDASQSVMIYPGATASNTLGINHALEPTPNSSPANECKRLVLPNTHKTPMPTWQMTSPDTNCINQMCPPLLQNPVPASPQSLETHQSFQITSFEIHKSHPAMEHTHPDEGQPCNAARHTPIDEGSPHQSSEPTPDGKLDRTRTPAADLQSSPHQAEVPITDEEPDKTSPQTTDALEPHHHDHSCWPGTHTGSH